MPPLTVASLQTITHSRPDTRPMPVMMPARGDVVVVHAVRGELRQLEERAARIEQRAHALARQQLAARDVLRARGFAAALLDRRDLCAQVGDERRHRVAVLHERRVARVELRFDDAAIGARSQV